MPRASDVLKGGAENLGWATLSSPQPGAGHTGDKGGVMKKIRGGNQRGSRGHKSRAGVEPRRAGREFLQSMTAVPPVSNS